MSQLILSGSFEYLCYVSTAIIHILLYQCGARLKSVFNLIYRATKSLLLETKSVFNTLRPEFTIVIFNHYKPRIAAAILDL